MSDSETQLWVVLPLSELLESEEKKTVSGACAELGLNSKSVFPNSKIVDSKLNKRTEEKE